MPETSPFYEDGILAASTGGTALSIATVYLSLHTASPGQTGANEEAGGGYARVAVSWNSPSAGVSTNSGTVTVNNNGTASYVGLWDAISGGNFLIGGPLTPSESGATVVIGVGDLTWAATN